MVAFDQVRKSCWVSTKGCSHINNLSLCFVVLPLRVLQARSYPPSLLGPSQGAGGSVLFHRSVGLESPTLGYISGACEAFWTITAIKGCINTNTTDLTRWPTNQRKFSTGSWKEDWHFETKPHIATGSSFITVLWMTDVVNSCEHTHMKSHQCDHIWAYTNFHSEYLLLTFWATGDQHVEGEYGRKDEEWGQHDKASDAPDVRISGWRNRRNCIRRLNVFSVN